MSDLAHFLSWFEGYAENIEEAPTAKQWGRIREKIEALSARKATAETSAAAALPKSAAEPRVHTKASWIAAYKAEMIDRGIDPDSAAEILEGDPIDTESDPVQRARVDSAMALNGAAI